MADPFRKVASHRGRDTADSLEIQRIVSLPIVEQPEPEVVEAFCEQEVQALFYERGFRLFPTQVGAVLAWDLYRSLFGIIGVGWGKTLCTLMIANRAFERGEANKIVLFVPSQVYSQLTRTDIPQARKWVGLSVPFHLMGGRSPDDRRAIAGSGKGGCYVMPYTQLSTRDAEALLGGDHDNPPPNKRAIDGIQPELIILDEAHNVKNKTAARTQRLMRYIHARQPYLAVLSGTITSKTIKDYHHLIAPALRHLCPLPQSAALAENWSYVLDPEKPAAFGNFGGSDAGSKTGPLSPLLDWARERFPEEKIPAGIPGFRLAYKLRLTSTPGVVSTGDAEIGVSLTLTNKPVENHEQHPHFPRLKKFMEQVEDEWVSPSGDEIDHGFHKWRYHNELTVGFYYHLRWPTVEELVKRGLSNDEAEEYLALAMAHHKARQDFIGGEKGPDNMRHGGLRRWIAYRGRPGLDTPLLVTSNMAAHKQRDVGNPLYELWCRMKELEFEGMPERISEPVRVCDYKIKHAVKWAKELLHETKGKKGAIVWVTLDEPGRWLAEELKKADLPHAWCPAESIRRGSNEAIADPKNADRIVVASVGGHGTGKNLQHFEHQLFLQFPRQADTLEQVLGRTHRNGQQADELEPVTINTLPFDHQNQWACLIDALYIHQTTGSRQKLIYASYNPLPQRYPIDFLRERGFSDVAQLDAETRAKLEEKFGPIDSAG